MNIVNLPSKVDNLRGDRGSGLAHTFHHVETTIANLRKKSPLLFLYLLTKGLRYMYLSWPDFDDIDINEVVESREQSLVDDQ